jgi:copper resistance protein D
VTALALCRFAHFLGSMLVFGVGAYLWLYAPDALRRALSPGFRRLVLAASLIALLSAVLWLSVEAASMTDDWSAAADAGSILAVLSQTEFGHVWAIRLVLAAGLVAAVAIAQPGEWTTITVLSGLLLASLALVGHAAMHTGLEGVLQRANHAIHLLAAGAWLGGLVAFVRSLSAYAHESLKRYAVRAMASFSFYGQFVVAALVLTGVVNIALISGHAPLPTTTPYRALLDAKIALVAVMIALALVNRYILTPRLKPGARALEILRLSSMLEVVFGTAVVALVSVFELLDPA